MSKKDIIIRGYYRSPKGLEQLVKEARWILHKYAEARKKLADGTGSIDEVLKWRKKWDNWSKAHPKEARQIEKQIKSSPI